MTKPQKTNENNERLQALLILTSLFEEHKPLSQLLDNKPLISPFTKELCFGVARHYYHLEALANLLIKKKPNDHVVWLSIVMGLYQLHYLRTPDYAVVQEGVSLLDKLKKSSAKGLLNAVLRRYCRERETLSAGLKACDFQYDHPDWLLKRLQSDWPNDWQSIVNANDQHPPMSLRVNRQKISRDEYLNKLNSAGIHASPTLHSSDGIILDKPSAVHELPEFAAGFVSVQDEAAQLAANLLQLKPGHRLLDACCAPGGKTCHSLEIEPNLANCVALDIDARRLIRVADNLKRLQLNATLVQADALKPETFWDGVPFDRILLDAPCSATGVIRRHPDIKLLRLPDAVNLIAQLQYNLLRALWPLLAPGGLFVYATCSILCEENEQQIARFVKDTVDCDVVNQVIDGARFTGHGWQIFPGYASMDGFFYSILKKTKDT